MALPYLEELRAIVGDAGLVTDRAGRLAYESDALSLEKQLPELVVLPLDTAQASAVMRVLSKHGVPIVPRGAGTGLAGGATPVAGGVSLSTARMREILEIDPVGRTARVQAGVVNAELTRRAAPHDLFYAPDPSSQAACTLGGNVANNSGGPHCFKHGATTRHVLGMIVVDADGEVIDLSHQGPDPDGFDLIGLIVGSEGMFGLVTEVTLKLVPIPDATETILAVFPSLDSACDTVTEAIARRLEPSAIEILDELTIDAVERSVFAAGYPREAKAVLLLECEGSAAEVEATSADLTELCQEHGCLEIRTARDDADRRRLWAGRKGAFGAMGRIAPDLYVADVVAPRTRLREIVRIATDICHERGLKVSNVFHAGDGNLHPNISYDRRDTDEVRRVLEAGELIMRACIERGGSLTGEHGVGLEKQEHMCHLFDESDLDAMRRAREALDPDLRMNPGKMIPIRGCREMRTPEPMPQGDDR
tara:strand:- start:800 stop:2233 length:1434 start_codon:yes stop_codon:yes gene_type:complete